MTVDYRDESCTYLMLKLKVALKKTDGPYTFLGTQTQVNTIEGAFPQTGYGVSVRETAERDTFEITITPPSDAGTQKRS